MGRELNVGDVVCGRFRLLDVLGKGASGVVFAARDARTGEEIALKTLHRLSAEERYRLKREFRLRRAVQHEGLVRLFELVDVGDLSFFTMELVRGKNFLRHIRGELPRSAVLPAELEPVLRRSALSLLEAVSALHDHQRIHRDIKPSNTMVTDRGRPVLLDFGLATSVGEHSTTRRDFVGTLAYSAPEQMLGRAEKASDLYSLGVMFYEVLTGEHPFGGSPLEMLMAKQKGLTDEHLRLVGDAHRELIAGLLDPDAARRWDAYRARHAIAGEAPPARGRALAKSVFVGRRRELARLHEALAELDAGGRRVVHIRGPSGIGKTELVMEFARQLRGSEVTFLQSRARLDETVAYRAVDPIIDGLSARLCSLAESPPVPRNVAALLRVFPVLARVPGWAMFAGPGRAHTHHDVRRQALGALHELFVDLSESGKVVLWIDDAQWGDADSAAVIRALAGGKEGPRVLVVMSYRGKDGGEFTSGLSSSSEAEVHLELGPLSREEAFELALELAVPDEQDIEALATEAAGSPFFVSQLVRHWQRSAGARERPVLSSDALVSRQLAELPPAWRDVMELVSVLGAPADAAMLERLAGPDAAAHEWLPRLTSERLLREVGGDWGVRVDVYHDRIQQVILDRLPAERIRELNRRIAGDLEHHLDVMDLRDLVRYWQNAEDRERASAHASKAAERAESRLAFDRAASLYAIAASQPPAGVSAAHLTERHAYAVACAGRGREAGAIYERAARLAAEEGLPELDVLRLRRSAVERYLRSGHLDRGYAALEELLADLALPFPRTVVHTAAGIARARARLLLTRRPEREVSGEVDRRELERINALWTATVGLTWADNLRSTFFQAQHAVLAFAAGQALPLVRALASEACYVAVPGGERARRLSISAAEAALTMAERLGEPEMRAVAMVCAAGASFLRGEWRRAIRECDAAEAVISSECPGADWERANCHIFGQWALCFVGDLDRLADALPGHVEQARARDDELAACYMSVGLPNLTRLLRDAPDEAARVGAEAVARWHTDDYSPLHFFDLVGQIHADLYRGRVAAARARFAAHRRRLTLSLLMQNQVIRGLAKYTELTVLLAGAGGSRRRIEKLIRDLRREDAGWCRALGQTADALLAWREGQHGEARSRLAIAERALEASDLGLFAGAAAVTRARLFGQQAPMPMTYAAAERPERLAWVMLPFGEHP